MFYGEQIIDIIAIEGLDCYETTFNHFNTMIIQLKDDSPQGLIKFAKTNNIKSVFYSYIYYDAHKLLIGPDQVKKLQKEIQDLIALQIDEYNEKVASADFTRACGILVFCLYQGNVISIRNMNLWGEKEGLLPGEQVLQRLVDNKSKVIEELREKERQEEEKKKREDELLFDQLRNYILKDPEFYSKTFPGARRDYIRSIFTQRKDTNKFKHLLFDDSDKDYVKMTKAVDFIEILWREKK